MRTAAVPALMHAVDPVILTAAHEAGHAVVTLALGGWVGGIYVKPPKNGHSAGGTYCHHGNPQKELLICLAGHAAEIEMHGVWEVAGCGSDFRKAAKIGGHNYKQHLPEARRIVRENIGAMRRIADELARTRKMSGERAVELFRNPKPSPTPEKPGGFTPRPDPPKGGT
jgi:hypothetical protein